MHKLIWFLENYCSWVLVGVGGVWTLTDMIQWFLIPAEIFISLIICPTVWLEHRRMRM